MKCPRGGNGSHGDGADICPAATETRFDGVHHGKNAGRACWLVAGTMCGGDVQGTFARKYKDCRKCGFYMTVRLEEGMHFQMPAVAMCRL